MNYGAYLSLITDEANLRRIRDAKKSESPEIPHKINLSKQTVWLGMNPEEPNSVIIRAKEAAVSRKHCSIEYKLEHGIERWYITDYSTNGTYIDNVKIPENTPVLLENTQVLIFGLSEFSALRYKFYTSPCCELKRNRDHNESPFLEEIRETKRRKFSRVSRSASVTTIAQSINNYRNLNVKELTTEIRKLIDKDALIAEAPELKCAECRDLAIFPLCLPCYHPICFDCFERFYFGKDEICPICSSKLSREILPYRHTSFIEMLERKVDSEVNSVLKILEDKVESTEIKLIREIRNRINAEKAAIFQAQLPIDSQMWTIQQENLFREFLKTIDSPTRRKYLIEKGLKPDLIEQADEERLDLMLERLGFYESSSKTQSQMQVDEKREAVKSYISEKKK